MRVLRLLIPLAALVVGCGLVEPEPAVPGVPDDAGEGSRPGIGDAGDPEPDADEGDATATTTSLSGSSIPGSPTGTPIPGRGNQQVILASTNVDEDGAIAADDANVYWTELGDDGVFALLSCPVSGCDGGSPREVWGAVSAGSVPGELVVENGLVYFQTTGGTLVDCPAAGCGAAPTVFAEVIATDNASASITSDGQNLYWEDQQTIYSCPLGAACSDPAVVTSLAPGTIVAQILVYGATLYWVDGATGNVEAASLTTGATSLVCNVPSVPLGFIGEGAFAILDGYAYVSTGVQRSASIGGIYRCALGGGAATLYSSGPSILSIASDGASLFWLAGSTTDSATLYVCLPGDVCSSPATFLGPEHHMEGFTLYGNYVYTVAPQIRQTTKIYP